MTAEKEEVVYLLKRFLKTPPGSKDHLLLHSEILQKASRLRQVERAELQAQLEKMRSHMMVFRPTYLRPDYYRLVTILTRRLKRRSFRDVESEIEAMLSEVEKGIRRNHFPKYPSSYAKGLRALLLEAARSEGLSSSRLARLAERCKEAIQTIYAYEYENVEVDVTPTRIRVSGLFTLGESQRSWMIEFVSPELEYGGRTFLKREVLAHMARIGKPLSRGEMEEGMRKKIPYFGHIVESLMKKYLIVPIPGENRYELTGTGKKVGEVYVRLLDRMKGQRKRPQVARAAMVNSRSASALEGRG